MANNQKIVKAIKAIPTMAGTAYDATKSYRLLDYIVVDGVTVYTCKKVDKTTMTCVGHPLTDTDYWDKSVDLSGALKGTEQIAEMDKAVQRVQEQAEASKEQIQTLVNALPVVQQTGDSTTSVMSQKAVSNELNELHQKTSDISNEETLGTINDKMQFLDNDGNEFAYVSPTETNFTNLKSNGSEVLTQHQDLSGYAKKDELSGIEEKTSDISKEESLSNGDFLEFRKDDNTFVARVDSNGVHAKAYYAGENNGVNLMDAINANTKAIGEIHGTSGVNKIRELDVTWQAGLLKESNVEIEGNGIRTGNFSEKGLYIVTFSDEYKVTYIGHVLGYDFSIDHEYNSNHPISAFKLRDKDKMRFAISRKDGKVMDASEKDNIHIYYLDTPNGLYDVYVAASDSKEQSKKMANIVLDGTNDTRILCALTSCYNSMKIFLHAGTYYMTEFFSYTDTAKVCLAINDDNGTRGRKYLTIHGMSKCTPQTAEVTNIVLTEQLHNTIQNDGINYFCLAIPYSYTEGRFDGTEIQRAAVSVDFKDFNVIGYYYDKPITYIDTTRCLSQMFESVNVRSWLNNLHSYNPFEITPNEDCTAIRVGRGSDYGIQNYVKHSNFWYCGKGVACNGEHFVFEDVKTHHDYVGFYFGDKKTVGRMEHPNIMLGCSIEGCYRLMVLGHMGATSEQEFVEDYSNKVQKKTLVCIGLSTELVWSVPGVILKSESELPANPQASATYLISSVLYTWNGTSWDKSNATQSTLPIKEIYRGMYRGRVEGDHVSFESGSGKNIVLTSYN